MVPGDGRALLNPTVPPGRIFKTIEKYWKTLHKMVATEKYN